MSYNLLRKLFGRTFWSHILVAHLLRKYVASFANMWQLFYNLLCKLFGHTFASQIYDNYCNSCSTSAGLWFACVRTEMPA